MRGRAYKRACGGSGTKRNVICMQSYRLQQVHGRAFYFRAITVSPVQVRGAVVVRWCRLLAGTYCDRVDSVAVNDAALTAYAALNGVPESLAAAAIAAPTEEAATELARVRRCTF